MHRPPTAPIAAVVVFVISAILAGLVVVHSERQRLTLLRSETRAFAVSQAAALQREIEHSLSLTSLFAALIRQGDGVIEDFSAIARELVPFYPGVAVVHLAPDGVVSTIYPLAGNESVLALDLLHHPDRIADTRRVRDSGRLTLTGPYDLIRGGHGVVGRLPVFLDDGPGEGRFWGFVSVAVELPELLRTAGFVMLGERGFDYRLERLAADGSAPVVIAASAPSPLLAPVHQQVSLPNDTWRLSLAPRAGWGDPPGLTTKAAFALGLSLLLAALAYLLVQARTHERRLAALLASRTAELRAREADLERAEAVAQVGSWDYDIQSNRSVNSAVAARITGVPTATALGVEAFLDRVYPPDRALIEAAWAAALAGQPYDVEHRCLIDGELRWLRQRAVLSFDADGKPLRALGTVEDITGRKVAELALRDSEAALRRIIETTNEGVWTLDLAGRTTFANPKMAEMLGCPLAELLASSVQDFADAEGRAQIKQILAERQRGLSAQNEFRFRRRDGSYLWTLISGAPLSEDGQVTGALGMISDISARKAAEEEVRQLAFYDPLTGLPNRRLLLDRLQQSLAAAARTRQVGAVMFIDLDHFKQLNDTRGHEVGDLLLVQVAERLTGAVRASDTVARLGGDEFVVLLRELGTDPPQAAVDISTVAGKLLLALGQPYLLAGQPHHSTPSIGVALFDRPPQDAEEIIRQADLAMYQAKAAGRNRLQFFESRMEEAIRQQAAFEADLRRAITAGELVLHFQPQVDTQGCITGAEALLRWRHPTRGLLAAASFIDAADAIGLTSPLGRWVLATACAQLVAWARSAATAGLTLAVNLSRAHFRSPELVADVRDALATSGADPPRLRLELGEAALLDDPQQTLRQMCALKALGVGLTLDNFGVGYASLSNLKRFPLDQVKLAPAFVQDVLSDPNNDQTADHFVALVESLGLAIMAEGVETESQQTYLAQHGCRTFQGFLFGRPAPIDAFPTAVDAPRSPAAQALTMAAAVAIADTGATQRR